MSKQSMLTTIDNPYDPFDDFDRWFMYDESHGYHSCSVLGRIARTASDMSDADNHLEIDNAINDIIRLDPTQMFKKVTREFASA